MCASVRMSGWCGYIWYVYLSIRIPYVYLKGYTNFAKLQWILQESEFKIDSSVEKNLEFFLDNVYMSTHQIFLDSQKKLS